MHQTSMPRMMRTNQPHSAGSDRDTNAATRWPSAAHGEAEDSEEDCRTGEPRSQGKTAAPGACPRRRDSELSTKQAHFGSDTNAIASHVSDGTSAGGVAVPAAAPCMSAPCCPNRKDPTGKNAWSQPRREISDQQLGRVSSSNTTGAAYEQRK